MSVLRRAGREDTGVICALLAEVFDDNPKADPAVLTWQYWDNPYGTTSSWLVEEDGVVLGHYAAFPIPGRLAGRPALLAMGADAATREAARGRGVFSELARAAWQGAADEGCRVILAAPNPNSRRGAVKAGMTEVADLPVYVRPLDDAWLAERFRVPRPAAALARVAAFHPRGSLRGEEVAQPPHGLDALWARAAPYLPWAVTADTAWWRWRYAERPGPAYRYFEARRAGALVGAAATTTRELYGGRFALVLDLVADDREAAAAALAPLAAAPGGAVGAALVAVPGSRLAALAGAAGFRRLPRRFEPRPLHFGVIGKDPGLPDVGGVSWSVSWSLLDHL
jgi:GNAT superfamily N-acetyltransferase